VDRVSAGARVPRWELGSLLDRGPAWTAEAGDRGPVPWEAHAPRYVATGRDALALALAGAGARRAWLPSYLCQELMTSVAAAGVEPHRYPDGPLVAAPALDDVPLVRGDAVVIVGYFGLRRWDGADALAARGAVVVEDHTHAPCSAWAQASRADYAIASLRKLLPIPDGGVVWSPRGRALPAQPALGVGPAAGSALKLAGMELKRRYLDGEDVAKDQFRLFLESGEAALWDGIPSGMTTKARELLAAFPLAGFDRRRAACVAAFAGALASGRGMRVLLPAHPDDVPFSALVELETAALRDRVHAAACAAGVYPSTLWPLPDDDDIPLAHRDLARRLLSVPADMRYRPEDLVRAASVFSSAV
jgi:hypothetical protein